MTSPGDSRCTAVRLQGRMQRSGVRSWSPDEEGATILTEPRRRPLVRRFRPGFASAAAGAYVRRAAHSVPLDETTRSRLRTRSCCPGRGVRPNSVVVADDSETGQAGYAVRRVWLASCDA